MSGKAMVPGLVLAVLLLAGGFWAPMARASDVVVYYHTDALRSVAVVTNASGVVIERTHYAPYGQVLNRPLRDGPGYTGHREDATTGLVYMQQRYYDPETGRFLSADPVQADGNGGSFNRYWYAKDNPYRYTDPDGRDSYLVSRPLDNAALKCCVSHDFVVTNAKYVGDPKATVYSYGKTNSGNTGRVNSTTTGESKGTSQTDHKFWQGLSGNKSAAKTNTTQIKAKDAVVDKAATSLKENTPYAAVPHPLGHTTNSNSASSAVADRAQGSHVTVPGGSRLPVGVGDASRIQFEKPKIQKPL